MESQHKNPEFRNDPENFHKCILNFWPEPSSTSLFNVCENLRLK